MSVHEQLAERLGVEQSQAPSVDDPLAELERRRQALAPEALAGVTGAIEELDAIEGEIARLAREAELTELAAAETAERDSRAAVEEADRQRAQWLEEKAALEATRDKRLAKVERSLSALIDAIAEIRDDEAAISVLGRSIDPNWRAPRTMADVENRIARRLRDVNVRADGPILGSLGVEPLGAPSPAPRARARAREKGAE